MTTFEKIRAEIDVIEINGQVDEHTAFIRTGEHVKQMALDIIDKYAEQEPKWIPVSERLPEDDTEVLITYIYSGHEIVNVAWINNREWYYKDDILLSDKWEKVIAWMPLPKPYKPQESEVRNDRVI